MRLTILHTNDVHAQYEAWRGCVAFIKARRRELGEGSCLTLDSGDHLDMSVEECGLSGGKLHLELLADAGVDAFTPGNNEFYRASRKTLAELSSLSTFPWLLSTVSEPDGKPFAAFRKSLIVRRGLAVGLLGSLAPMDRAAEELHGLRTLDAAAAIAAESASLRAAGADLVVLLSHCGIDEDLAFAKASPRAVDVIVGGHSHTELAEPVVEGGTIIVQAGGLGRFVGELSLDVEGGRVVSHDYSLHAVSAGDARDEAQARILETYRDGARAAMSRKLRILGRDYSRREIIALSAELCRRKFDAEFGMMFEPAATAGLARGELTVGQVYEISRSFITPASFEVSGRQIAGLIAERNDEGITGQRGFGIGFRPQGQRFGRLEFAGVDWDEGAAGPENIRVAGAALDPERWYRAGSASHLSSVEGGGYPSMAGSRNVRPLSFHYLRELLVEHFAAGL